MGEMLVIALALGGGILCAFACLLIATFARKSEARRIGLYVIAFLALLAQWGCWSAVTELGTIGRGRAVDEGAGFRRIVFGAAAAAFIWALILEWRALKRWQRNQREAAAEQSD